MRRAIRPFLASIAVMCAALSCFPPTDVKDGERVARYPGASRSLANGVTRADSLRLGVGRAGLMAGGARVAIVEGAVAARALMSSPRLLDPVALCGIEGWILPRGIQLLRSAVGSLFLHTPYQSPLVESTRVIACS